MGLSKELVRFQERIQEKMDELDINKTKKLLPEYETSLGLPNNCFSTSGTIEDRRSIIIAMLARFPGVSTIGEIQKEVIDFLGIEAKAITGWDWEKAFPGAFPDDKTSKNTLVIDFDAFVRFPLLFPARFSSGGAAAIFPIPFPLHFSSSDARRILQCILILLLPAHVDLVFKP